ncbi:MAG: protein phosphatase 2C domain-containing protein [Tannerellaceae bacterium]|jgi:protein phosphatase|nr:protein phosphatase 2C domain-containing protein [Tannerellaceae bacterium]
MNTVTADKPCAFSDPGRRLNNEDAIYPQPETLAHRQRLFIVCDGVGGSQKGEVASALACESIQSFFAAFLDGNPTPDFVQKAIHYAQTRFDEYIALHPQAHDMATTLTLIYVGDSYVLTAFIGDSRIYQFRNGAILFRTQDHSLVNSYVNLGIISPQEARSHPRKNVILKALQASPHPVDAEINILYDVKQGDSFFLCSDGVLEALTDESLSQLFSENRPVDAIKDDLVELCSLRSHDNYSFYIVPIPHLPDPASLKHALLLFFNSLF